MCEDGRCAAFVRANAEDVDAAAAVLYPGAEAEGMHARTFLCREALWEAFEDIAREQGASIDDVLAEAMRAYARHRAGGAATGEEAHASAAEAVASAHDYAAEDEPDMARTGMIRQPTQRMSAPTAEAPSLRRGMGGLPAPPPRGAGTPIPRGGAVATTRGVAPPHSAPPQRMPAPLPELPGRVPLQRPFTQPINQALPAPPQRAAARFPSAGMPLPPPARGMSPGPRSAAPPPLPPPSDPYMAPAGPYQATGAAAMRGRIASALSLTYLNRSVEITKDRFILGRSKSQADLVLDDANVSRQHAAIERVGDTWFLADLGSTNGCYVDGQRVSRRQLSDGDVIEITTHQVRCTLR